MIQFLSKTCGLQAMGKQELGAKETNMALSYCSILEIILDSPGIEADRYTCLLCEENRMILEKPSK